MGKASVLSCMASMSSKPVVATHEHHLGSFPQGKAPGWTVYVDESGSRTSSGTSGHFVLGGLVGSPVALGKLAENIRVFKIGLAPGANPKTWELHAKMIMRGRGAVLKARTQEKKMDIFRAAIGLVCESDVELLGIVVKNKKRQDGVGSVELAMAYLVERFELFLQSRPSRGIGHIVSDRVGLGDRQKIARVLRDSRRGHNPMISVKARRVISIRYEDSLRNELVQVADIVAYVINRHVSGHREFEGLYRALEKKFWRSQRVLCD